MVKSRVMRSVLFAGFSGGSVYLLFLAWIGFASGKVPTDALAQIQGQPQIIRFTDEALLGIPIAKFWSCSSLTLGIALLVLAIGTLSMRDWGGNAKQPGHNKTLE